MSRSQTRKTFGHQKPELLSYRVKARAFSLSFLEHTGMTVISPTPPPQRSRLDFSLTLVVASLSRQSSTAPSPPT